MDTKRLFNKVVNLLTLASFLVWNLSVAAPQGSSVSAGSATVSQSGTLTTVNQTSQNAVINWNSFNTASNEAVKFNQPNSSAVALNRITNGQPTQFAGQLSANGNVWILNPAGVLFTSTSRVDVAGLLATTHSITDANFMAGNYQFDLVPGSEASSILNNGTISAADSGLVALVAPHVENNGLIQVNFGRVALATGASYTLDMYGDSLINFGSNAPISSGSVSNAGTIIANGGKVYMTANAAAGVLDNVISMSGTIQATSVTNGPHGEIILNGGHAGRVKVSGTLDASDGGFIETSGEYVDSSGAYVNVGVGGTWSIDPTDLTIDGTNVGGFEGTLNGGGNLLITAANNIFYQVNLTATGTGALTLSATSIIFNSSASTAWNSTTGGSQTFNGTSYVTGVNAIAPTETISATGAGSDITFNGQLARAGAPQGAQFILNAGHDINFTQNVLLGYDPNIGHGGAYISSTAGDKIFLGTLGNPALFLFKGGIVGVFDPFLTAESFYFHSPVVLNQNVQAEASIGYFGSTIDSNGNGQYSFESIGAPGGLGGATTFLGNIGGGANGILASFRVDSSTTYLNFDNVSLVRTYGSQIYDDLLVFMTNSAVDKQFIAKDASNNLQTISFSTNNLRAGFQGLPVNSVIYIRNDPGSLFLDGNVIFNGDIVGTGATQMNALTVTGTTTFNGFNNSGATITAASQEYRGAVTLNGPTTTLNSTGLIKFGSTIDGTVNGAQSLEINPTFLPFTLSGNVEFDGSVGATTPLDQITLLSNAGNNLIESTLTVNPSNTPGFEIKTTNAQQYYMQVLLAGDATFISTGDSLVFNNNTNGPHNLTLTAFNPVSLGFKFDQSNYLNSLTVTNATDMNWTGIQTVADQTYGGAMTLHLGALLVAGGNIIFQSTVDGISSGAQILGLNAGGTVQFQGNVGSIKPLNTLGVTAASGIVINPLALNAFSITTTGAQTYNGDIQLTLDSSATFPISTETLTASDITTNGTITIPTPVSNAVLALVMDTTNNININGNILLQSSPGSVHAGGFLYLNAGNKIFINTPTITVGAAPYFGPSDSNSFDQNPSASMVLMQTLTLSGDGQIDIDAPIDANTLGGAGFTIMAVNDSIEIFANIGATTPLSTVAILASGPEFLANEGLFTIHTTGDQTYDPLYHVAGTHFIVDNPASAVTFNGGMQFDSSLSNLITGNAIFNSDVTPESGSFAGALTVTGTTAFNGARNVASNVQDYQGAVTINSGSLTTLAGSTVTFENTVESTGTPAQLNIGGNLVLANSGSIGQSSDVSSLVVHGTSSLRNAITTTGDPVFMGAVTLTADTMITDLSVTGIVFQSTIDSDAFGPWSLTLNAPSGPVAFQGDIGNSAALHDLIVQNATEIDLNTPANPTFIINTTGIQNYTGDLVFSVNGAAGSVVQYYLTAGSDITVNNQITAPNALTSGLDVFINSTGGDVFLKGNILLDPSGTGPGNVGGYLDVTAGSGKNIFLGSFGALGNMQIETANVGTPTSLSTQSFIFRSPILLDQNVDFTIAAAPGVFDGSIDSDYINHPGSAFALAIAGTTYYLFINAPIGSLGELQSVNIDSNNFGVDVGTLSQDNDLFPGIPNFSVTTVADQTYLTSMFMYIANGGTVLFKSDTGTVTFTETDGLHALEVSGGCVFACPTTFNGNTVLNGDISILGGLTALNGSLTLNNVTILTFASQEYDGTLILNGANNVLHANNINQTSASNIYFAPGSSIDGQGNNLTLTLFQTGPSNSYRDTAIFDNTMTSAIGTLSVTADKVTQSAGGALTATNLTTNTNEGMDLSQGTNQIQNFIATNGTGVANQSEGDINLTNTASPLNIASITQNGNNIFINNDVNIINTGTINITGPIVSPVVNNTVFLMTNLNITQSGAGVITADILSTSTVTGANLTTAINQVNNFTASNTVSGDIALNNDTSLLTLTGITQTGGNVTITNSGDIKINNDINALGEIVTLTSTLDGIPQWVGNVNADTLNANTITGSNITGTVNNYSATNTTSGNVNFTNNQTLNITGITQNGGNLSLLAFGSINQTGAIAVIGNSGITTSNGSINLANGVSSNSNDFQGPVSLLTLSSGDAQIFNNDNLSLSTSNIAGNLTGVTVSGANMITIIGDITAGGSQTYNNPVIVDPLFNPYNRLTLTSSTGITFNSTVDDITSGRSGLVLQGTGIATFNQNVGSITPLLYLTVGYNVSETDFNGTLIHTAFAQEFTSNLVLSQPNVTLQNDQAGDFDSVGIYIDTGIVGPSTRLEANGDIYFGENSGSFVNVSLTSLTVDTGMAAIFTDGTTITTSGAQTYNGQVLLENNDTQGPVTLVASTPGSIITFNQAVINDDWNNFTSSAIDLVINADLHAKADIGPASIVSSPFIPAGRNGTLNSLAVNGDVINFSGAVTQVNTFQTQTYNGATMMTMDADPTFTASSFSINIPVLINANTIFNSTAGDIDFKQAITGDSVSSLLLQPVGGSAIFENTVGTNVAPLGSLTVNGTSIFNQGSAQDVYTNGDQIYVGMAEIDNNVSLTALTTGRIALGTDAAGFFDNPSNSYHLNAVSNNASYGATGQGITGHVNVGSFTVGGAGGANVSPISKDSVVATSTGDQAFVNWLISPEIADTYYCINGAAGCSPQAQSFNIPPVELFNINPPVSCDASGCSNLETMIDNMVEAGVVECGGMSGCAFGFATAEDTNGKTRILVPGSVVYVGDKIMKEKDSCVCVKSLYGNSKTCMGAKDQRGEVKA